MNEVKLKEMEINGITYVPKGSGVKLAENIDGLKYVVIRSKDAGCHAGYLLKDNETSVELVNSRRLWYWSGACSLSQLAMEGVNKADDCKFAMELPYLKIINHCEIIHASDIARESIEQVAVWKK